MKCSVINACLNWCVWQLVVLDLQCTFLCLHASVYFMTLTKIYLWDQCVILTSFALEYLHVCLISGIKNAIELSSSGTERNVIKSEKKTNTILSVLTLLSVFIHFHWTACFLRLLCVSDLCVSLPFFVLSGICVRESMYVGVFKCFFSLGFDLIIILIIIMEFNGQ